MDMTADAGPSLLAGTWVLTPIAIVVVALRMYTRLVLSKYPGPDDWTMLVGTTFNVFYSIMITVSVATGTGRHAAYLTATRTEAQVETCLLVLTICQAVAIHSFTVTKLSVAFLLVRLFNPKFWTKVAIFLLPIALICVAIVTDFVIFFQITPIRAQWTPPLFLTATHWSPNIYVNLGYTLGTVSAVIDILFGLYPVVVLYKLNMKAQKRAGLAALFAAGLIAAAFTIYKTTLLPPLATHEDLTYGICALLLWTSVEANIVIIAACLPTLIPLFKLAHEHATKRRSSHVPSRQYLDLEGSDKKRTIGSRTMRSDKRKPDTLTSISLIPIERSATASVPDMDTEAGSQKHSYPEEMETYYTKRSTGDGQRGDVHITTTYSVQHQTQTPVQGGSNESKYSGAVPDNIKAYRV